MTSESSAPTKRRGRPSKISSEQIVKTALSFGVDRLSMHGVAKELGVSTTALYRHVASKEELVTLCADHVLADLPGISAPNWHGHLIHLARRLRQTLLAHPGSVGFIRMTGLTTPTILSQVDAALGALKDAKFAPQQAFMAVAGVISHVTDMVLHEEQAQDNAPSPESLEALSNMPHVAWAMAGGFKMDHQLNFEKGLEIIIEGIKAVQSKG